MNLFNKFLLNIFLKKKKGLLRLEVPFGHFGICLFLSRSDWNTLLQREREREREREVGFNFQASSVSKVLDF